MSLLVEPQQRLQQRFGENAFVPTGIQPQDQIASTFGFPQTRSFVPGPMTIAYHQTGIGKRPISEYFLEVFKEQARNLSPRLIERIRHVASLDDNWDGERAQAPKTDLVANGYGLILVLKSLFGAAFIEPFFAPTHSGTVHIEWHVKNRCLEIEVAADGWIVTGSSPRPGNETLYHEATFARNDLPRLIDCYKWFAGTEMLWPVL